MWQCVQFGAQGVRGDEVGGRHRERIVRERNCPVDFHVPFGCMPAVVMRGEIHGIIRRERMTASSSHGGALLSST